MLTNHRPLSHVYPSPQHHTASLLTSLTASRRTLQVLPYDHRIHHTTVNQHSSYPHILYLFSLLALNFVGLIHWCSPIITVPRYLASIGSKLSALSYSKSNGLRVGGFLTLLTNLSTPHFSTSPGPGYIDSWWDLALSAKPGYLFPFLLSRGRAEFTLYTHSHFLTPVLPLLTHMCIYFWLRCYHYWLTVDV